MEDYAAEMGVNGSMIYLNHLHFEHEPECPLDKTEHSDWLPPQRVKLVLFITEN